MTDKGEGLLLSDSYFCFQFAIIRKFKVTASKFYVSFLLFLIQIYSWSILIIIQEYIFKFLKRK